MIVVDSIVEYPAEMTKGLPGRFWCHCFSPDETPAGEQELIAFGARIGMQRRWLQHPGKPDRVHFDLTRGKRLRALRAGAIEVNGHEYARARLAGPEALAAYLKTRTEASRPIFGVTPPPEGPRGCLDGGGRRLRL